MGLRPPDTIEEKVKDMEDAKQACSAGLLTKEQKQASEAIGCTITSMIVCGVSLALWTENVMAGILSDILFAVLPNS